MVSDLKGVETYEVMKKKAQDRDGWIKDKKKMALVCGHALGQNT